MKPERLDHTVADLFDTCGEIGLPDRAGRALRVGVTGHAEGRSTSNPRSRLDAEIMHCRTGAGGVR